MNKIKNYCFLNVFPLALLILTLTGAAAAATLIVDNTTDDAALAACAAEAGDCSLREAIAAAAAGDTVTFDSVSFMMPRTIRLTNGFLIINKDLTVAGVGGVIVDANRGISAFFVQSGTVNISGITVTGANGGWLAGTSGIVNRGMLTLSNMVITGNNGAYGGGISNFGTLNVVNSTISDNRATEGGGINSVDGTTLNVTGSTISNNTADFSGAGIHLGMYASAAITNSAVVQNTAYFHAGILSRFGNTLNITNSTFSGNQANAQYGIAGGIAACLGTWTNVTVANNSGGGVQTGGVLGCNTGGVIVRNSLFAGNGSDVRGQINSQGYNLVQNRGASSGYSASDLPDGTNPLIGALANNGGLSPTHALLPNSPAINAGNNAFAVGATDQREAGFNRIARGGIDIGAFEYK